MDVLGTVGFGLTFEVDPLKSNFEANLKVSSKTNFKWGTASTSVWTTGATYGTTVKVRPRTTIIIQVVGKCGYFNAFTEMFRMKSVGRDREFVQFEYFMADTHSITTNSSEVV
jgi:hypothetical protein